MCSICVGAGSHVYGGQVDAKLKTSHIVVLPIICVICRRTGANIVVGRYVPNGQALLKRLDHDRQTAAIMLVRG